MSQGPTGNQGARGLAGIQGPRGPVGPVATSNQNGVQGDFEVVGDLNVVGTTSGVTKSMVGLGAVDNTSDAGKPISTAAQAALNLKADKTSVTSDISTAINSLVNGAPGTLDTLKELSDALNADESVAASLATLVAGKAPLASPVFTGSLSAAGGKMVVDVSGNVMMDNNLTIGKYAAGTSLLKSYVDYAMKMDVSAKKCTLFHATDLSGAEYSPGVQISSVENFGAENLQLAVGSSFAIDTTNTGTINSSHFYGAKGPTTVYLGRGYALRVTGEGQLQITDGDGNVLQKNIPMPVEPFKTLVSGVDSSVSLVDNQADWEHLMGSNPAVYINDGSGNKGFRFNGTEGMDRLSVGAYENWAAYNSTWYGTKKSYADIQLQYDARVLASPATGSYTNGGVIPHTLVNIDPSYSYKDASGVSRFVNAPLAGGVQVECATGAGGDSNSNDLMFDENKKYGRSGMMISQYKTPAEMGLLTNNDGEWNTFKVECVGWRQTVWINDQLVGKYFEDVQNNSKVAVKNGPISCQFHHNGGTGNLGGYVEYRNFIVKELNILRYNETNIEPYTKLTKVNAVSIKYFNFTANVKLLQNSSGVPLKGDVLTHFTDSGSWVGKIALITRGGTFTAVVNNAQLAGCIGIIIYNYVTESSGTVPLTNFGDTVFAGISVPWITISYNKAQEIIKHLKDNLSSTCTIIGEFSLGVSTLAVTGKGASVIKDRSNPKISEKFKSALTDIIEDAAWKDSYGPIVNGTLPYGNNIFTPVAGVSVWRNGDEFKYTSGISDTSGTKASNDTIYPMYSMTKSVVALLYQRLKTLGIAPQGNTLKMSTLFTDMSGIVYSVPYISARVATMMKDAFGVPINMKDTSGVNIIDSNGSLVYATEFVEPSDVLRDTSSVAIQNGSGAWICSKDTSRELYVDDVFSESVGFASTGFNDLFYTSYFGAYVAAKDKYYGVGTDAAKGYDGDSGISMNPIESVNYYFTTIKATGKKCLMLHEHGVLNYNSSSNFGTAVILQLYKNKYPTFNGDFFDLLKKELLEPCGAGNMFYYLDSATDPRKALISGMWDAKQTDRCYKKATNGFAYLGEMYNNQYMDGTGSLGQGIPKNYAGASGIFGTISDYVKVITLHATGGITQNGVRLINANDISNMRVPRVTSNEWSNASILDLYASAINKFSLGGTVYGPSYTTDRAEPTFQRNGNKRQGDFYSENETLWDNMFDTYSWNGAGGTVFYVIPSTKTVIVFASMEFNTPFQNIKLVKPISNLLNNDFSTPDNLVSHVGYSIIILNSNLNQFFDLNNIKLNFPFYLKNLPTSKCSNITFSTDSLVYDTSVHDVQVTSFIFNKDYVPHADSNGVADTAGINFVTNAVLPNGVWKVSTDSSGVDWFRSGDVGTAGTPGDNGSVIMNVTIPTLSNSVGKFTFMARASTETGYDFLNVYKNGNKLPDLSVAGENKIKNVVVIVASGDIIKIAYVKDELSSYFDDVVYIKDMKLDELNYTTQSVAANTPPKFQIDFTYTGSNTVDVSHIYNLTDINYVFQPTKVVSSIQLKQLDNVCTSGNLFCMFDEFKIPGTGSLIDYDYKLI